jgi:hypothetical protein
MTRDRGAIRADVSLRLWVLAGGRCEYRGCNKYLLEDEVTSFQLNLAERAHIVGATNAAGSPRGDDPLPIDLRDNAANLMLLCGSHHRVIDRLIEKHSVEGLRSMKREHEDRVRLVTGFTDDAATVVVRAVGGIRNGPVEIPRETVLAAVLADGHFPRYPLAMAGEDLEIDLRVLPAEGSPDYWTIGERIVADRAARIRNADQPIQHLSVFALARIPLLVALGFHLDDKIPATIYGRRRGGSGDGGWGFGLDAEITSFEVEHVAGPARGPRVAVAVSITAPIGADAVAAAGEDCTVYEIGPQGVAHGRDLLAARASLGRFAEAYGRLLGRIEADHRGCGLVDVFAAAPAPAAVQLGRSLMREAQPALRVHDRGSDGHFHPALVLGDKRAA